MCLCVCHLIYMVSPLFPSPSFYAVVVARRSDCPSDLGATFSDPGPYRDGSSVYIAAAWSCTPVCNLTDSLVPVTFTVGDGSRTNGVILPNGTTVNFVNPGLSPSTSYCVFVVTQRSSTTVPNVSQSHLLTLECLNHCTPRISFAGAPDKPLRTSRTTNQ